MKIYLVRHGQTLFNKQLKTQGWCDSPLTDEGVVGAKAVGLSMKEIEFDRVYYSELGRQRITAKHILNQNEKKKPKHYEHPGLKETFFGSFEGLKDEVLWNQVYKKYGLKFNPDNPNWNELSHKVSIRDVTNTVAELDNEELAETYDEVNLRVDNFINDLEHHNNNGNVLVVSSGGTISLILEKLVPTQYNGDKPDNCSVSIIEVEDEEYSLIKLNDLSFLNKGKALLNS